MVVATVSVLTSVPPVVEISVVVDVPVTGVASRLQAELKTSGEKVARSVGVLMALEEAAA